MTEVWNMPAGHNLYSIFFPNGCHQNIKYKQLCDCCIAFVHICVCTVALHFESPLNIYVVTYHLCCWKLLVQCNPTKILMISECEYETKEIFDWNCWLGNIENECQMWYSVKLRNINWFF